MVHGGGGESVKVFIEGTEKELLRKQLELLAEQSIAAEDRDLANMSSAMCEIYRELKAESGSGRIPLCIALLSVAGLDLLVSIIVLIENLLGG